MGKLGYMALAIAFALAAGVFLTWDGSNESGSTVTSEGAPSGAALVQVRLPETLTDIAVMGKRAFEAKCIACHGENAAGVDGSGPPLVHKIYEPGHHGDAAFWLATQNGVRAHHWNFGNMPPIDGLTQGDVAAIVAYIRALQTANGIL
ncbi:c-type cytochrome [Alphaproteobacteria bacterium GH1-50]|uniref:C-type cytochrome n=1 Tax=Kangsaoukella pontilimi TaxID=2691042 RepID=A0A7C9MZY1_9RHOB|nr:cytochrome c [Kangsaoukella pontilimi]MXQ07838.1 c-type cytochrome [Kangsaoukella pontilimi]